ncbi:hypothetical protein [Paenibacillus sp. yr247]|uniref:hypothetical protein n=1 Tax=Paenibacillus sp. yr247 TaxID=1761880 RepID=UPI001C3183D3|nr:hypothetical protein [Paenibacillus sp. yr247]
MEELLELLPELDMLGTVDLLEDPPLKPEEFVELDELPLSDVLGDVLLLEPPLKVEFDLEPVEKEPDLEDVLGELPFASAMDILAVLANNKIAVTTAINLVFILQSTFTFMSCSIVYLYIRVCKSICFKLKTSTAKKKIQTTFQLSDFWSALIHREHGSGTYWSKPLEST